MDGIKHVLGIWVQYTEGASFWAHVCAELANRGIRDVLIVCCDGLTGLAEAIEATWPDSMVQTCVVHLIRAANWIAPGIIEAGRLEEGDSLMPVKCSDELKARAVDLVLHAQADKDSAHGAITRVANELGLSKETLRVWVRKHKSSGQDTPGESVGLEVENRRLRAELAEARRANEILRKASAFFAAELDRPSK